ncbi:MAG: GAF domain-containing protein, partial [Rhodospirillaceae bacterium]|nr:GAF domain-containing protein [Rhodospirillaceae bacterium]
MRVANASIRSKLFLFYLIAGILPLLLIAVLGLRFSSNALLDKSFDQLVTVQSLRKARIEHDFAVRLDSVKRLNQRNDIINLFAEITALPHAKVGGKTTHLDTTTPAYQDIVGRYSPSLRHYLATYAYRDLLLLSDDGRILYSLKNDPETGHALEAGPLNETGLTRLWQRIAVTRQTAIIDFSPYGDDKNAYAAFIGQPFFGTNGRMKGIIALRLGPELIDAIVTSREGMGKSGESYIVAFDPAAARYEFRTTVRTTGNGNWVMGTTMPSLSYWDASRSANGRATIGEFIDSSGTQVLAAADGLNIPNVDWTLVSKINHAEVVAPVRSLGFQFLTLGIVLIVFTCLGALVFANTFTAPILKATKLAESIAAGQLNVTIDLARQDELGILSRSLDTMARRLREHSWLMSGSSLLNDALRGEHDPTKLTERFLTFMTDRFGVPLGAIYLTRNDAQVLTLSARHGWTDRDANRMASISFGDGMIGQAAANGEPLYFDTVDADAPMVDYGAGDIAPTRFAAIPLIFEGATL